MKIDIGQLRSQALQTPEKSIEEKHADTESATNVNILFETLSKLLAAFSKYQIKTKLLSMTHKSIETDRDKKSNQLVKATNLITQLEKKDMEYDIQLKALSSQLKDK